MVPTFSNPLTQAFAPPERSVEQDTETVYTGNNIHLVTPSGIQPVYLENGRDVTNFLWRVSFTDTHGSFTREIATHGHLLQAIRNGEWRGKITSLQPVITTDLVEVYTDKDLFEMAEQIPESAFDALFLVENAWYIEAEEEAEADPADAPSDDGPLAREGGDSIFQDLLQNGPMYTQVPDLRDPAEHMLAGIKGGRFRQGWRIPREH